jgi:hypothetical protein
MRAQLALQQYEPAIDQQQTRSVSGTFTSNGQIAVLSLLVATSFIAFNPSAKHETTLAPHGSCLPGSAKAEVETTTSDVSFEQQPSANWIVSVQCPNFGDYGCCLINPERKRAT